MSTAQAFNFSLVLRSDVTSAKAGLADVSKGMQDVTTGAGSASAAVQKEAAQLERLAAAAAKAGQEQDKLAGKQRSAAATPPQAVAPLYPLANPVMGAQITAPVTAAFKATETAAGSLRREMLSFNATVGAQAAEMVEAAQSTRQYQAALDEIRASYNPLFAVSRQYEQQLDRISEAERMGAITAREAAAARASAARQLNPDTPGQSGVAGFQTSNIAAQFNDIGVTAAMGMSPIQIALQQGTQLSQVFNEMGGGKDVLAGLKAGFLSLVSPISLVTIGVIALGVGGIQWLMSLREETKTYEEALADLTGGINRVKDANDAARAGFGELRAEFGSSSLGARSLLADLADIERRMASVAAKSTLDSLVSESAGGSAFGLRSQSDRFGTLQEMFGEASWYNSGRISQEASPYTFAVTEGYKALGNAADSKDINVQISAAEKLFEVLKAAAELNDGISKDENVALQQVGETIRQLQILKAQDENAAGNTRADEMLRQMQQRLAMEQVSLTYGADSIEYRSAENQQARENLIIEAERLGLSEADRNVRDLLAAQDQANAIREQQVAKARDEAQQSYLQGLEDQIGAVQRETSLIGASAAEQARVNALAAAELQIRDRKLTGLNAILARTRAIADAEAQTVRDRQMALRDLAVQGQMDGYDALVSGTRNPLRRADIEYEREFAREMARSGDATIAAAAATRARAQALAEAGRAQQDHLRGQAESIQQLELELALVGQTAEVRARVLALVTAERDIARLGATGNQADAIREAARAELDLSRQLQEQADAWRRVQSAGEQAIDGVLDRLREGDVGGAFKDLIGEIEKGFFDLSIRNPLKNMLLGTNLGTWEDVGGFAGIRDRFSGKPSIDEDALVRAAVTPVQDMTVTAGNVVLAGNLSGIANALAPANINAPVAPFGKGGSLGGSADVQAQVWGFFAQKGLQPHQIAGIMGNVSAESGFNPLARGDGGDAYGLFQHNDRAPKLLNDIGGVGNLGDVQAQLQFVWKELLTTEAAAMARLMSSTDVRGATEAFVGFERPQGYSVANPSGSMHFDKRLAAAEAAMVQFEAATGTARQQLGQLGNGAAALGTGLEGFGSNLAGMIQQAGAQRGIGGSILGSALTGLGAMIGIPGFARGGWTGAGATTDVAGMVHAEEYVFDAAATKRIGVANLEAIRNGSMKGYRQGGYVSSRPAPAAPDRGGVMSPAAATREPVVFNINVTGTGNSEVQQAITTGIAQAFDAYDSQALPDRVKMILNDKWGS